MDFSLRREDYLVRVSCGKWVVRRAVPFRTPRSAGVVPAGFATDLCTCAPDGDWWLACLVHDFLYVRAENGGGSFWEKTVLRRRADQDLAWLIQHTSRHPYRDLAAAAFYLGVRVFGGLVFWRPGVHA